VALNNKNEQTTYLKISVSIGFAVLENDEETVESLIQKSDALMYVDKMGKRVM